MGPKEINADEGRRRQMSENNGFAKWFGMQREDRQLTADQAVEYLGLSLNTILSIEAGVYTWAQIPPDIKVKIRSKFGEYPTSHSIHGSHQVHKRSFLDPAYQSPGTTSTPWDDILEGIEKELEKPGDKLESPESEQSQEADDLGWPDAQCDRCQTPLTPKDEGCPECGRRIDMSH